LGFFIVFNLIQQIQIQHNLFLNIHDKNVNYYLLKS